ncbi:SAM-dependent methyltransferase, type 11 [Syntrophotalea carbinolica DSM 2380]|uniref:SAM-dependent methyltransferase, type 11 n=1 Tax=Syntrophotalea carbinolica (strain DSM 2380 / NBRC 103641 / GraBd1) TaxID=338963 RepID=Q3A874_SYNC1|nr:class I SAM-dependent methyltransferase [Syntrophotalea carbinolica]ABA87418.1 SAM-dependent methyltransferase, type 11 [Syntrophotalea carbinolica DSM 2380]
MSHQKEERLRAFYRYDQNHPFASMYPLLAKQIVDDLGVTSGRCLDIGTGSGALLIELGKITSLELMGLDINPETMVLVRDNAKRHDLPSDRIEFLHGDVHALPLPDNDIRLVVSRGSIPFWDDHATAFAEIYRVLQPEGVAFVGGGFSRYQSKEEADRMRPAWVSKDNPEKRARWLHREFLEQALSQVPGAEWRVIEDGYGTWVEMRKPAQGRFVAEDTKGASHAVSEL